MAGVSVIAYFAFIKTSLQNKTEGWAQYISPDKKLSFEYPSKIFFYENDAVEVKEDSGYTKQWANKKVAPLKADETYSAYGQDYMFLWAEYVSLTGESHKFPEYLSLKAGEDLIKTQYQTDTKVTDIENSGVKGYIYKTVTTPELGFYSITAVWPVGYKGMGKYEISVTAVSNDTLDSVEGMFMEIVSSVKISD